MSDDKARRASVSVTFAGADITKDIKPYFMSLTYKDGEEDLADDLQLNLVDRDGIWLEDWLNDAVDAAAAGKLTISAVIAPENWGGGSLPTGDFELDSVSASGPGSTVSIKGTSLPFSASIRQTKKSRAWESYNLSGIASEIAGNGGLGCMFESGNDPFYARQEQWKESDIDFLSRLCHDAGLSLKATDGMLVIFDQADYESRGAVLTLKRAGGKYIKYKLSAGSSGTQYGSCRVSYTDPGTGQTVEGTTKADGSDTDSSQCLEVSARVSSEGEAKELAAKLLRLHNKFERTASFTLPGDPGLVAGVTVMLESFGGWSGKYIIKEASHTVDASGGYTTTINLRRILEGY